MSDFLYFMMNDFKLHSRDKVNRRPRRGLLFMWVFNVNDGNYYYYYSLHSKTWHKSQAYVGWGILLPSQIYFLLTPGVVSTSKTESCRASSWYLHSDWSIFNLIYHWSTHCHLRSDWLAILCVAESWSVTTQFHVKFCCGFATHNLASQSERRRRCVDQWYRG